MKTLKILRAPIVALAVGAFAALAHAQFQEIYTFNCSYDGCSPYYADLLAQGVDGNLYGTLATGVYDAHNGSWFEYQIGGAVAIHDLPYSYTTPLPSEPNTGLTLGIDGNLYGATIHGGLSNGNGSTYGLLFKISGGVFTPLYYFTGGAGGSYPYAPPIQGPDGNLYGVTCDSATTGYVYQVLTASGTLGWIHQIPSGSRAPLILASDGNFYGTTPYGSLPINGVQPSYNNGGEVFRVTPAGVLSGVYNLDPFSSNNGGNGDGAHPWGPVMQANDGFLYGTGSDWGAYERGVVFQLKLNGPYTVVHNFQGPDGVYPMSGLLQGSDGFLYGLTSDDGVSSSPNVASGTLFKVQTNGGNFDRLFTFYRGTGGKGPGSNPFATPTLHTNGLIYGLTLSGGTSNAGSTTYGAYDDGGELFGFDAGLKPFISIVGVRSGHPGQRVGIIGQGFLNATGVTFGSTSAPWTKQSVTIWSDTYMTVSIPAGATTGPVTVMETTGSLSTLYDFVIPKECPITCVPLPPIRNPIYPPGAAHPGD